MKMPCEEASSRSSCSSPDKNKNERENSVVSREAHNTFWHCFNEVAIENDTSQCHNQGKNPIACEIDSYLNSLSIGRDRDRYIWWSANAIPKLNEVY